MPNALLGTRPLDRETLQRLCAALAAEMERRNAHARVYIVAGRVFTTAWRRDRAAPDGADWHESDRGAVDEAVRTVADRHGAPRTWLDDLARAYPQPGPDVPAPVVFSTPYLVATGAPANFTLAMLLEAGPPADEPGIRALLDVLKIRDPDEAATLHANLFPDSARAGEVRALLRRLTAMPPDDDR